ncbi:MAG: dienelactone hydrolase family protein [Aquabacterium sp.]
MKANALFALVLLTLTVGCAHAKIVEDIVDVPVTVRGSARQEVSQSIKLTIFRDDSVGKAPYLVLNHGRPADVADFPKMGRQRFSANSRYFVSLGFVVLVPTRVGYGEMGGPDVEYSGQCNRKNFAPAVTAAADQTIQILQAASKLAFVDVSRGLVVGQSFGGLTAISLASRDVPGLKGAVNFSGGSGGNPVERPEHPCSPDELTRVYERYGKEAKVPTLWLYSENDQFWGPALPRQWFDGYTSAGGKGRFIPLPSYQDNGHGIFTGNPDAWKAAFEAFAHSVGF